MKRGPGAPQMRPLRHGFQVIDRFGGFDFNGAHQPVAPFRRRQHQVGEYLDLPYLHWYGLVLPDVGDYVVPPLQLDLQQPDDPVMLELLTNRTYQNRTHT